MQEWYIDFQYSKDELERIICKEGLLRHNIDKTNGLLLKPGIDINIAARSGAGNVIGGIMCETYLLIMDIEVLWVAEAYRGQGIGYKLITEAEKRAKEAECVYILTGTYSFQSPHFYKRQGYEQYAVFDGFPNGICYYRYKKKL